MTTPAPVIGAILVTLVLIALLIAILTVIKQHNRARASKRIVISRPIHPDADLTPRRPEPFQFSQRSQHPHAQRVLHAQGVSYAQGVSQGQQTPDAQPPTYSQVVSQTRPQPVATYIAPDGHVETSGFYKKSWQDKLGSWYGRAV